MPKRPDRVNDPVWLRESASRPYVPPERVPYVPVVRPHPTRARYPIDVAAIAGTACPKCGQPKKSPCVYLMPRMIDPNSTYPSIRDKLARVGRPTWATHNERRNIIRWRQARNWARERSLSPPILRATESARAAWRAGREFDRQEYGQLKSWYLAYGDILWKDNR